MKLKKIGYLFMVTVLFASCAADSNTPSIVEFSVAGVPGEINGNTIRVVAPLGTDLSALEATVTVSAGATVTPESGTVQDFTNPAILYTVTALGGATKSYVASVIIPDYYVGQSGQAGGLVFYDRGEYTTGLTHNWRYLEAALTDQSSSAAWSNVTATLVGTELPIGTGEANTAAIIAQPGHTASAAKLCDDLEVSGYSDWFLPSKGELYMMFINLQAVGFGDFASRRYWSSSEDSDSLNPWYQAFFDGGQSTGEAKTSTIVNTRCIRAF